MTVRVNCIHCKESVKETEIDCPHCGKPVANSHAPTKVSASPRSWTAETQKSSKIPFILIGIIIITMSAVALHHFEFIKL